MRAIVVSRFPISREALARVVGAAFGPEPAIAVASVHEARDEVARGPVDMVVAETMAHDPEFRELKALAEAIKPAPLVLFAVLSQSETQGAYDIGAKGVIPRTAPPELVIAALRLIRAGGLYFSDFSSLGARPPGDPPLRTRLSGRQLEVLRLIEIGQTNKEIAKALGISVATVKLHVQAILNITGARNRTEAALRARGQVQ